MILGPMMFGGASSAAWRPIVHILGTADEGPLETWWNIRACILTLIGGLYRRFVVPMKRGSLSICRLFDPRLAEAERRTNICKFLSKPACCHDRGCGRKLRLRHDSVNSILADAVTEFFIGLLNAVPLTSTPCELDFASVRQWLAKSFKPFSVATLNSKYFVDCVDTDYQAMTQAAAEQRCKIVPSWDVGFSRRTGFHEFQKERGTFCSNDKTFCQ